MEKKLSRQEQDFSPRESKRLVTVNALNYKQRFYRCFLVPKFSFMKAYKLIEFLNYIN